MKNIVSWSHRLIAAGIYMISCLIPKNKNIWVFGAWRGQLYADNAKYLFEYVTENKKDIRPIWISQNTEVVNEVRSRGDEAYLFNSIKGIVMSMRASAVFETEGNQDVIGYAIGNSKIIQLWHGMSVKRLDSMDRMEGGKKTFYSKIVSGKRENIYYMVSSEECRKQFKEVFHTDDEHIKITGFPRNDTFISKPKNTFMENFRKEYPGCKIIIYMPTHRNFGQGNKLVNTIDALKYVNDRLKVNNIYMIYKPHFHEMKNFLKYENELSNIIIASDAKIFSDVYSYLYDCDLLISDYSSVMNDFVCADKPVISFPYDLKDYSTADMGLYEFYEKMSPGPMCYTWEDVVDVVIEALEKDTWKSMRAGTKSFYHVFSDGKNCERVYEEVVKIVKR